MKDSIQPLENEIFTKINSKNLQSNAGKHKVYFQKKRK